MVTLQGSVSASGEYPSGGSSEILSAEVSDTYSPSEPELIYANPEVPYSVAQGGAVGAGGQKIPTAGGGGGGSKQLIIYNSPLEAEKALAELGLGNMMADFPAPQQPGGGTL